MNINDYGFKDVVDSFTCGKNVMVKMCNWSDVQCPDDQWGNALAGAAQNLAISEGDDAESLSISWYD